MLPKKMRIYTRTGDKGMTSLYTGERRFKFDQIFKTLGDLDELNSHLGVLTSYLNQDNTKFEGSITQLSQIQHQLFDIGSFIATPKTEELQEVIQQKIQKTELKYLLTDQLEN